MTLIADLVILGGVVFDGVVRTKSTAVAIAGDRIVRVGSDKSVRELIGPDTRVVEAAGGLIHPGFVDAHVHAAFAGVERLSLDLTPATTVEETLELIRDAAGSSDAEWLTGGGWDHELLPMPTRHQLDAIVPDRPVALSDAGPPPHTVGELARARAGRGRSRYAAAAQRRHLQGRRRRADRVPERVRGGAGRPDHPSSDRR